MAVRAAPDQLGVVEVVAGVEADAGRQPTAQRDLVAGVQEGQLDAVDLPGRPLDQLQDGVGGGVEVGAAPVAAQRPGRRPRPASAG